MARLCSCSCPCTGVNAEDECPHRQHNDEYERAMVAAWGPPASVTGYLPRGAAEEDAMVARIKQNRRDRGIADARAGEPPTEANAEYQAGYASVRNPRAPSETPFTKSVGQLVDVWRRGDCSLAEFEKCLRDIVSGKTGY